jgi:hypothetical protein
MFRNRWQTKLIAAQLAQGIFMRQGLPVIPLSLIKS